MNTAGATPILIFDAQCGFCTSFASWAEQSLPIGVSVVGSQLLSDQTLVTLRLTRPDVERTVWWVDEERRAFAGHRAIGKALANGPTWWRIIGWLTLTPPTRWLAAAFYFVIARFRHRLPGATSSCRSSRYGSRRSSSDTVR